MATTTVTGTALHANYRNAAGYSTVADRSYVPGDGFDLIWVQTPLQTQMVALENAARLIMKNSNLTDTERMFEMQMTMNAWSAIASLRTNCMKVIADDVKMITRNIA